MNGGSSAGACFSGQIGILFHECASCLDVNDVLGCAERPFENYSLNSVKQCLSALVCNLTASSMRNSLPSRYHFRPAFVE